MRLIAIPGVFRPLSDSWLLARSLREEVSRGAAVADVCTGSGMLAVTAALHGAGTVAAVDRSRRSVLSARLNAIANGVRVEALKGDLFSPLAGRLFDVIVSNPPYVPAASDEIPARGAERAWDAGRDGRALLDPICGQAPGHLAPGGALLVVHSNVCGEARTRTLLEAEGLAVDVVARETGSFGPLMASRRHTLRSRGLVHAGQTTEELVVIRARALARPGRRHPADDRATASQSPLRSRGPGSSGW